MIAISVYVGKYDSPTVARKDEQKLKAMGLTPYLVAEGKNYSWKVFSHFSGAKVQKVADSLIAAGYSVHIQ